MAENQVIACHKVDEWKQQFDVAKESKKLVVIDFTASWCPPCRFIAPVFVELAKKYPDVVFFKVDVDELKEVAAQLSVEAMPTFVFMKDGEELKEKRIVGADKDKLERTLVELTAEPSATA